MDLIKIALQKAGRLHEESIKLIKDCGISIKFYHKLKAQGLNFPLDFFFLRDDEIPKYVKNGIVDLGIVGKNIVYEQKNNSLIKENLGFGFCRISLAVPKETIYTNVKDLSGKCIATSYPTILKEYLDIYNICSNIHEISGSVEIAPNLGIADAICDIVGSGETLDLNNLKEIEKIFYSEAVLICSPFIKKKQISIIKMLIFRIQAVKRGTKTKLVSFIISKIKLNNILYYLDNMKCTVLLKMNSFLHNFYVQAIVQDNLLWMVLEKLKMNCANHLLVLPIQKNIP